MGFAECSNTGGDWSSAACGSDSGRQGPFHIARRVLPSTYGARTQTTAVALSLIQRLRSQPSPLAPGAPPVFVISPAPGAPYGFRGIIDFRCANFEINDGRKWPESSRNVDQRVTTDVSQTFSVKSRAAKPHLSPF